MENLIYIIIGIVGIFVFLQFLVRIRSWGKRGKPAPQTGGKLGQIIQRGEKVIAYFYSPTCSACRTQEKYLPKVQEKFQNIIRINAAKNHQIARTFGVMGTPTTVVIDEGIIKAYFVGVTSPAKILKTLGIN